MLRAVLSSFVHQHRFCYITSSRMISRRRGCLAAFVVPICPAPRATIRHLTARWRGRNGIRLNDRACAMSTRRIPRDTFFELPLGGGAESQLHAALPRSMSRIDGYDPTTRLVPMCIYRGRSCMPVSARAGFEDPVGESG